MPRPRNKSEASGQIELGQQSAWGAWLQKHRELRGISRLELGQKLGHKNHGHISNMESLDIVPRQAMIEKILIALLPDDYTEQQYRELRASAMVASGRLPDVAVGESVTIRSDGSVSLAPEGAIVLESGKTVHLWASGKEITLTPELLEMIEANADFLNRRNKAQ